MMYRLICSSFLSVLLLLTTSCGDDSEPSSGDGSDSACTTDADCQDDMSISIWYPTCSDNVLQTPTGTGEKTCVEGACETDFQLVDTDCEAEGRICGPNPDEGVQGDTCIDPS